VRIETDGLLTAASLLEIFAIILPNPQWEPPSTSAAIVPVWDAVFEYDNPITDLNLPGQHILQYRKLVHRPDTFGQHKS
jgi:hypothetical protein